MEHHPLRLNRRIALAGIAFTVFTSCSIQRSASTGREQDIAKLRQIEKKAGGRLGAYIYDTANSVGFGLRENERFAHCSSFKMSLAAMLLSKADRGEVDLGEMLRWSPRDMLPVSPVTQANVDQGLTVEALAHATLVTSDNTAANVLLRRFGGPPALTAFWRSLGDAISQLDRFEPELNEVPPGTTLDSTSPKAMAMTTAALVHGDALTPTSKAKLKAWMTEVQTGSKRIRAGLPQDWESGDKTGTGIGKSKHTYVDIAFGGPSGRSPLIIAAYFEPEHIVAPMDPVSLGVIAEVGRTAAFDIVTSGSRSATQ